MLLFPAAFHFQKFRQLVGVAFARSRSGVGGNMHGQILPVAVFSIGCVVGCEGLVVVCFVRRFRRIDRAGGNGYGSRGGILRVHPRAPGQRDGCDEGQQKRSRLPGTEKTKPKRRDETGEHRHE